MAARPPQAPATPWPTWLLALTLLASLLVTIDAGTSRAAEPPDRSAQAAFMWGLAGQESGWDYYERNRLSGAFGKYQIMPFNWPSWAARYLGDPRADQGPANQERVAWGKVRDLYQWLGSWSRVAYWWLTGSTERDRLRWSDLASGYVANVLALKKRAPTHWRLPPRPGDGPAYERGDWRLVASPTILRLSPDGREWRTGGRLRDGLVVRVRRVRAGSSPERLWLRVVTAGGRLGWVPAWRTLPTRRPDHPRRWSDVTETRGGAGARRSPVDRSDVRPRPR